MVDKDRVEGKAEQAKGSLKKGAGEMLGDEKMKAEGEADKAKGKVQDSYGAAKDKARDTLDKS
ncbi:CsbD family protein [Roseomonas sp. M0104]|uniref:CsbD family protein n=1 Tax=Teichococcus coralli TaxID=2545983 RepID=A0A845BG71_9PROT|nr:CsbD family protein [Pseudoroseomonas coralli]MXP65080.1 CsbD family protein [Pseudoroseomonas coralli]